MNTESKKGYKWFLLLIMCLTALAFNASTMSIAPNAILILKDVPMNDTLLGILMSSVTFTGIIFAFFISQAANKFNRKLLLVISLTVIACSAVLMGFSNTFWGLLTGRAVSGLGMTSLVIICPLFLTAFFDQKSIGRAMAFFGASQALGLAIPLNIFGPISNSIGWRSTMFITAAVNILVMILCLIFVHAPEKSIQAQHHTVKTGIGKNMWFLGIAYLMFCIGTATYTSFSPVYFGSQLHQSQVMIGIMASLIMLIPVITSPLVGFLLDTAGRDKKKAIIVISSIIMGCGFIGIGTNLFNLPLLWAVIIGIGFAPIGAVVYAAVPEVLSAKYLSIGMGMLIFALDVGASIGPVIFGGILDLSKGSFAIAFSTLGILIFLAIPFTLLLRLNKNSSEVNEESKALEK